MASGIRNPHATYTYRGDDWSADSFWTFRREQTSDDRDAVQAMTTKTIVGKIDRKRVRDLMKTGGDVEAYISSVTDTKIVMTTEKAMLARMGVKVEGEFFTVPADYCQEDGTPDPMAGQVIPQPPSRSLERTDKAQYDADFQSHIGWLGLIDPEERSAALLFMSAVWAGADPESLKTFQGGSVGVEQSPRRRGEKTP